MRIHYFQHVPFEGLGCIEDWVRQNNHQLSHTRFYETEELPSTDELDLLIVMGGPMGVYDESLYPWLINEKQLIRQMITANKPVLGICLGAQLIAEAMGSKVYANAHKEIGWYPIETSQEAQQNLLFYWIEPQFTVFHWHGDTFDLPDQSTLLFSSQACKNQGFIWNNQVIGLQFHLEVTEESISGMIENCRQELTEGTYIQDIDILLSGTKIIEKNNQMMFRLLDRLTGKL